MNSFGFLDRKERITNYVKEYSFEQLVEKSSEDSSLITIYYIVTASLIKLIDKITENEENFKEFHWRTIIVEKMEVNLQKERQESPRTLVVGVCQSISYYID